MTNPPPDIIAAARAARVKWGIPASVTLAQWAVESAWGKSMPPASNNPFGIKAVAGQPSVTVRTREVDRYGQDYYVQAPFRKYDTIAAAFNDHGRLLAQAAPYAAARKLLPNADAFADALTGVYATDPRYGATLKAVMRGSNLYQYDAIAGPPAKPA